LNGKFEFLGWWKGNCNTWHLDQPLEKIKNLGDNMVLLRRKQCETQEDWEVRNR